MFQKIRYRLLLNQVLTFAIVLIGFAIAVRLVFARSLHHQTTKQLVLMARSAADETELEQGRLFVEDEFYTQFPLRNNESFEWFDLQGDAVESIGKHLPSRPFDMEANTGVAMREPMLQSMSLPITAEDSDRHIGYVRASLFLDEVNATLRQLDIGLGVGIVISMVLSSAGILWLNEQATRPIGESFRRLKQFTADASHELRNPLMAISSNMEVALKYSEGMRAADYEAMTAVVSAANQMTRLTEDLLLLARTDSTHTMQQVPFDLSMLLEDLVQIYSAQAKHMQIELLAELTPDLWVEGEAIYLTQAFTNVLQNAIRYTPTGGIVKITTKPLTHQIQVAVEDTGVGIACENLGRIFERFWRANKSREYDENGAGLGLSISSAIVAAHGGKIDVTSNLGTGSCFVVSLPRVAPS
ncbi:MAG: HAMP domain-containing sensor histidine kinase [Cyanobacteria bacterium J06648_10]